MLAVPEGFDFHGADSLRGRRIATTYPFTLERWLRERNISAEIVTLSGAVEIAPRLGRADLICDLVSSGSTLAYTEGDGAKVIDPFLTGAVIDSPSISSAIAT